MLHHFFDERLEWRGGEWRARGAGVSASEAISELEGGDAPEGVARRRGIAAGTLALLIAADGLGGPDEPGPGLTRRAARRPKLGPALREELWSGLFPRGTRGRTLALAAGLNQVQDFWNASHEAAQEADDLGEGLHANYWHAIAHRREPDPFNASYWFRRVSGHPVLAEVGRDAPGALAGQGRAGEALLRAIGGSGGGYDPFAFVEYCRGVKPGSAEEMLARRLQRLEMALLTAATIEALG